MEQQGRLDGRYLIGLGLGAIISNTGGESGLGHRQFIHLAATPAETDSGDLAGAVGARRKGCKAGARYDDSLFGLQRVDQVAGLVLIIRRSSPDTEIIGRQSQEPFRREATRYILDMRIEAAILGNDDDPAGFGKFLLLDEIA